MASLFLAATKNSHQLFNFFPAVLHVIARQCAVHTGFQMIVENHFFQSRESGFDGLDLSNNVDAISIFGDHLRNTAYLTFNPGKAFQRGVFCVSFHVRYPVLGITIWKLYRES